MSDQEPAWMSLVRNSGLTVAQAQAIDALLQMTKGPQRDAEGARLERETGGHYTPGPR